MTQAPTTPSIEQVAESSGVFPPFDPTYFPSQLFWLALTFIALYFALDRIILPKIKTTIEDRRDRIADDLDVAAQAQADAEAAGVAYEKALAEARSKAHGIAAETRKALDIEIARETAGVESELAAKQEAAETTIRSAKTKAFAEVRGIAVTAAEAIVAALTGVTVSSTDAAAAVDSQTPAKEA